VIEDGCTCTCRVGKYLSLVVGRMAKVVLGVGRVRCVECRLMEREGEARLDNNRMMRVGREA